MNAYDKTLLDDAKVKWRYIGELVVDTGHVVQFINGITIVMEDGVLLNSVGA